MTSHVADGFNTNKRGLENDADVAKHCRMTSVGQPIVVKSQQAICVVIQMKRKSAIRASEQASFSIERTRNSVASHDEKAE